MATKKKAPDASPLKLLGVVAGITALIINYYLLEALLPDTFVDATYGPSILGRSFSGLAVVYNALFVVLLLLGVYLFINHRAAQAAALRKKHTTKRGAVVGAGQSERYMRRRAIYGGGSLIIIVALIGAFGALTSSPSNALSSSEFRVKLTDTSYSVIASTKSPTGNNRYINAEKEAKGKLIDTMQAGTTDGTYLYFAFESPKGGGIIAKYDLDGNQLVKSTIYKPSEIGHANGITYNPNLHKLVLSTWNPDGKDKNADRLAYVDPATLKIDSYINVKPSSTVTNICYNAATNQYLLNGNLYDASFNVVKEGIYNLGMMGNYGDKKSFGQGITCDANKIYVIRYLASKTKPHTNVYVYDWAGNLTSVYRVKGLKDEAENIFMLNGAVYMGVNNGSTYLGKSSDNKNDYYIRLNDIAL